MKLFITALAIAALTLSCNSPQQTAEGNRADSTVESFYMRIERTPCFGACPTDVLIVENKNLTYEGVRHVDRLGKFSAQLTDAQYNVLRQKFNELNFFQFEDKYDSGVTDLPSTIFEVSMEDTTKTVVNRYMGPESLKSFEIWVFSYVDNLSWSPVEEADGQ